MNDFVVRLQTVLKEKKISQTEMAQKIGISRESFTYWKNSNSLPNSDLLFKIAEFVEVDPYWLVKGEYQNNGISDAEQAHIKKFRQLSPRDKKVVSSLCDILLNEKALSSCGEGQEPNLEKI